MGDMADALLDGEFDEWTGEYIGPGVGYPRSNDPDHPSNKGRRSSNRPMNPVFGVENYLKGKGSKGLEQITAAYFAEEMGGVEPDHKIRCKTISEDFNNFVKWFQKRKK